MHEYKVENTGYTEKKKDRNKFMIPNSCLSWLVEKCKKNNNDLNNLTTNIAELTS